MGPLRRHRRTSYVYIYTHKYIYIYRFKDFKTNIFWRALIFVFTYFHTNPSNPEIVGDRDLRAAESQPPKNGE
jgi:hypothetical protein